MEHVLDNPAWNAMISGNKHLSDGNDEVRYFDKAVSPFAAFKENTQDNFLALYDMLPHTGPVLFVTPVEVDIPAPWKVLQGIKALQMVFNSEAELKEIQTNLTPLKDKDASEMVALAKLTNPGPFELRTIEFGHYRGIFDENKLVAMAGQRLHPFNYAEISAVCTHPDHIGKGYARQLLVHQVNRIRAVENIPFLHVRENNERAIKVYESLDFTTRRTVWFYVMVKTT